MPYEELLEHIRAEASDLDRLVKRASSAWNHCMTIDNDQSVYLDSVALNIHGFY